MDAMLALRAIGSLLIVLGLLAGLALLLRRYGHKVTGLSFTSPATGKSRLAVIETRLIDARTKLVLIRRDETEHLIMVSAVGATVIESAIKPETQA